MTYDPALVERQREALTALNAHVEAMQTAMVTYLTGGSDKAFIGDMLVMLDGPEQRAVQERVRRVLAGS
jgi:hypothetical protein